MAPPESLTRNLLPHCNSSVLFICDSAILKSVTWLKAFFTSSTLLKAFKLSADASLMSLGTSAQNSVLKITFLTSQTCGKRKLTKAGLMELKIKYDM